MSFSFCSLIQRIRTLVSYIIAQVPCPPNLGRNDNLNPGRLAGWFWCHCSVARFLVSLLKICWSISLDPSFIFLPFIFTHLLTWLSAIQFIIRNKIQFSCHHLPPPPHLSPFLWLPQRDPVCSRTYILYVCDPLFKFHCLAHACM